MTLEEAMSTRARLRQAALGEANGQGLRGGTELDPASSSAFKDRAPQGLCTPKTSSKPHGKGRGEQGLFLGGGELARSGKPEFRQFSQGFNVGPYPQERLPEPGTPPEKGKDSGRHQVLCTGQIHVQHQRELT